MWQIYGRVLGRNGNGYGFGYVREDWDGSHELWILGARETNFW
jgi:hypothetical protein